MAILTPQVATQSKKDRESVPNGSRNHVEQVDDDAVMELKEPYVKSGFMGMFQSKYVVLCAFVVRLGGFLFGYDQGVVSIILVMEQFLDVYPRVSDTASGGGFWKGFLTAMLQLGAVIGAFNQGWIADRISRKYSIVVAVIFFVIGSVLQTAAVDYAMLITGRAIAGIGVGMLSMVVPMYIAEVSPPEIRGSLLVLEEFSIVFGIIIAYWITFGTRYINSEWSFRLPFLLQIFPALLLGVSVLFLPFSPRWLASKGRDDEALASLCKLRRVSPDDPRVQAEWLDIRTEVALHKELAAKKHPNLSNAARGVVGRPSRWKNTKLELAAYADCFKREYWRRTIVGVGLMFFQQFVGINALIYYSPSLFETMGIEYEMRLVLSGVLNITQLVGVTTSLYTMDRYGRRPLLLLGSVGMTICHIIIAVLVGLYFDTWDTNKDKGWVSVAFLFAYMLIFGMTWGPVPWAMPSEIFPSSIRSHGVAWSTCSNWLNNFIIGLITPPLVQNTRGFGAYTFFAVFCMLSIVWTYIFVPETKGRSLESMDLVFKADTELKNRRRRKAIKAELKEGDVRRRGGAGAGAGCVDGGNVDGADRAEKKV